MSNLKHIDKFGEFVEATDPNVAYQINMDDDDALNEVDRIKKLNGVEPQPVADEPKAVEVERKWDKTEEESKPLSTPKKPVK